MMIRHARIFLRILPLLLPVLGLCGCKDDPVEIRAPGELRGTVRSADGTPVSGASVYLAQPPLYFGSEVPVVIDSMATDGSGRYAFGELEDQNLLVYAGQWDSHDDDFSAVSPFSAPFSFPSPSGRQVWDPVLTGVVHDGVVSGKVLTFDGTQWIAADSVEVTVERYLGGQFVVAGQSTSGVSGDYAVAGLPTANCIVHGRKVIACDGPFPAVLVGEAGPFFCDGSTLARAPELRLYDMAVEKPAIYIYPATAGRYRVSLNLNSRVRITRSEPAYGAGWDVFIAEGGRIDGRWDYLFYEAALQGVPLLDEGWCLPAGDRAPELRRIVRQLGLDENEAEDFLAYWLPRLPRSPWLTVKPLLGAGLDHLVAVRADPAPDSVRRFWLLFSAGDREVALPAPVVAPFVRRGTVLVEWGGLVVSPLP